MHSFWFILHLIHLKPCVYLQCLLKGLRIKLPIGITLYLSLLVVESESIKSHWVLCVSKIGSNSYERASF